MPHVMNYEEIKQAAKTGAIIYEEIRSTGIVRPLRYDGYDFIGVKHTCFLRMDECDEANCSDYNLFYRCWDKEPSGELMDSTPWKQRPDGDNT